MNCILNNDESSIDSISDDDYVIIIEDLYYLDDSYINSLMNENEPNSTKNVNIFINGDIRRVLRIAKGTKLSQLIKALLFFYGPYYRFYYGNHYFEDEKNQNDIVIQHNVININSYKIRNCPTDNIKYLGKIFNLKIYIGDEKGNKINKNPVMIQFGSLNSIKTIIEKVEVLVLMKIQKVYFNGKEINFKEDKCLLSLGIKENSTLYCVRI